MKSNSYGFLILLWSSIFLGGLTGWILGPQAQSLKPLGDIFLNLMFTFVVPLVFLSISSAIAGVGNVRKIGKIAANMIGVFILLSLVAAVFMMAVVILFPPAQNVLMDLSPLQNRPQFNLAEQGVSIFTVSDFIKVFSRENMLALIVFSAFVGFALASLGEKAKGLTQLLNMGAEVFMKIISYIMYYAPVGFFAYFAVLAAELGPQLLTTYSRATLIYYGAALIYFVFVYTLFAYLAGKKPAVKTFWGEVSLPAVTALATCSSAASIPANLQAAQKMKLPAEVYEMVIPLGSLIHKEGSILGAMVKIAFLFGIFHLSFTTPSAMLLAILTSLLVGLVMGAIPSGGLIGEMLILSIYGFPSQYLMVIAAISLLIDPLATMLNVTGNTVSAMLITRLNQSKCSLLPERPIF